MTWHKRSFADERGFTLVELMAATAISVMFSAAFFAAFFVMRNELYQQNIFFSTNRAARFGLDYISRDVKEAIRVVPTRGGDTTGNTVLILELPSIRNDVGHEGEATDFDNDFDYVVYKLDSVDPTILRRSLDVKNGVSNRNSGADLSNKEIARKIQSILFSTTGGTGLSAVSNIAGLGAINAQVTARGTTLRSAQTQTTQVDSNLKLRNKSSF